MEGFTWCKVISNLVRLLFYFFICWTHCVNTTMDCWDFQFTSCFSFSSSKVCKTSKVLWSLIVGMPFCKPMQIKSESWFRARITESNFCVHSCVDSSLYKNILRYGFLIVTVLGVICCCFFLSRAVMFWTKHKKTILQC